jgi:hypothetical protein
MGKIYDIRLKISRWIVNGELPQTTIKLVTHTLKG